MDNDNGIGQTLERLERGLGATAPEKSRASVLIPLLAGEEGPEILFEVRAAHLKRQPGEVCLPGGHIEAGEDARTAAIRETCEELLVSPGQIGKIVDMGNVEGPGGMPLRVFAASLDGYAGTFDPEEVGSTFRLPLAWFVAHDPDVYQIGLTPVPPDDFPWHLVPGGRSYPWRSRSHEVPFYQGTNPIIWGFTARVMQGFVAALKADSR